MSTISAARWAVEISGIVQGVGFRPFIHRLAISEGLSGHVRNTALGVALEIEGREPVLHRFLTRLRSEAPPRARIERVTTRPVPALGDRTFHIEESIGGGGAAVTPDIATCARCLSEMLDPADRRFRYPFTTCVDCGPRYSIVEAMPFDRARTTMRRFPVCDACDREYRSPERRRFHAETIACPDCGPHLSFHAGDERTIARDHAAIEAAVAALNDGQIVAFKGLGGFQLLVDATNGPAIGRLRNRKQRPRKPFAVMVRNLADAAVHAGLDDLERCLLTGPDAPIVLARARPSSIAEAVAPGNPLIGLMLPSTPAHHLLLRLFDGPMVATSGNRGGEPIVIDEVEACDRLAGIADGFLVHDRPIRRAVDDSIVRVIGGQAVVLRRARGLVPDAIPRAGITRPVIAYGGQQKNAAAIGFDGRLILGPHIGDLDTPEARDAFARAMTDLPDLHGMTPSIAAHDTHPDYHATRAARDGALPATEVPHHLAHVLSVMADNELDGPVLGVAWDGTGLGNDRTIWGGEFFSVTDTTYRRVAYLRPFPLPGGEAAVREPRRAALGLLHEIGHMDDQPPFAPRDRAILRTMMDRGVNAPQTSSAGRLFDGVAALLGLCTITGFEGEAAMDLEFAADRAQTGAAPLSIRIAPSHGKLILDWEPLVAGLIEAVREGNPPEPLAAAFHDALADAIVAVARANSIPRVVLSGGCFQNARLTERTVSGLRTAGFMPYWHRRVPPNDGGLAAGQALFAARPLIEVTA